MPTELWPLSLLCLPELCPVLPGVTDCPFVPQYPLEILRVAAASAFSATALSLQHKEHFLKTLTMCGSFNLSPLSTLKPWLKLHPIQSLLPHKPYDPNQAFLLVSALNRFSSFSESRENRADIVAGRI